ncbi:hypothetical protein BC628DRAFT_495069 [Trametes gibbosa]|nr:hypothetical protein BC628DRAFT_495069 [Trametes gibbosa]
MALHSKSNGSLSIRSTTRTGEVYRLEATYRTLAIGANFTIGAHFLAVQQGPSQCTPALPHRPPALGYYAGPPLNPAPCPHMKILVERLLCRALRVSRTAPTHDRLCNAQ